MRPFRVVLILCACTVMMVIGRWSQAQSHTGKETAVVEFTDKTKVMGAVLYGKYFVVHDEARMAKGEPCLFIYRYNEGEPLDQIEGQSGRLIVSFRCRHVDRSAAREPVLTLGMTSGADPSVLFELREIQLPGSTVGHQVPSL